MTGAAVSPDFFYPPANASQTQPGSSIPLSGIVDALAGAGDTLPYRFVWFIFVGFFVIGGGFLVMHLTNGNVFMSGATMVALMGLAAAMGTGLMPGWVLWLAIPMLLAIYLTRRGGVET